MNIGSDWIHVVRDASFYPALVEIDASCAVEIYGANAFWVVRDRAKGRVSHLGRGASHWRDVAELIVERQGLFGRSCSEEGRS